MATGAVAATVRQAHEQREQLQQAAEEWVRTSEVAMENTIARLRAELDADF